MSRETDLKTRLREKGWNEQEDGTWAHWTTPTQRESLEFVLEAAGVAPETIREWPVWMPTTTSRVQWPNPDFQRFTLWFTDMRPWALARHGTTMGDDTITFLFAPWADSQNKPRHGLPKSHKGIKYLQKQISERGALEGVYLVPVSVKTDFEQADFGVGERGDQPVARGRIFLTFKQVDTEADMRHQMQRQKRRRERNPASAGDLVRQLKF